MSGASQIFRSVGTFARSSLPKVSSGARTRGALGTETLHKIQCRQFRASIQFQSVAILPGDGNLRLAIDACKPLKRLASRTFSRHAGTYSRGTNFSGGIIQTLRSLFTRYPLIPLCQETTSGSLKCFVFSPIPFVASAHDEQHAAKDVGNAQNCLGEFRNVVR